MSLSADSQAPFQFTHTKITHRELLPPDAINEFFLAVLQFPPASVGPYY